MEQRTEIRKLCFFLLVIIEAVSAAYNGQQYGKASSSYHKKTVYGTPSNMRPVPNYDQPPYTSNYEAPAPPAYETTSYNRPYPLTVSEYGQKPAPAPAYEGYQETDGANTYAEEDPTPSGSTFGEEYQAPAPAPEQYETYEDTKPEYATPAANYEDTDEGAGYEKEYQGAPTAGTYETDDDDQYQQRPDVYEDKPYPPKQYLAIPAEKEDPPKKDYAEDHEPCGEQKKYPEAQKPDYPPETETDYQEEIYPDQEGVYVEEESNYEARPVQYQEKKAGQRYPAGSYPKPMTGEVKKETAKYSVSRPQARSGLLGTLGLASALLGDDDSDSSSGSRRRSRHRSSREREQDEDTIRQLQMQGDSQDRRLDREKEGRRAAEAARDREQERRREAEAALRRARDAAAARQADAAARLADAEARLAATRTAWNAFAECRRTALEDLEAAVRNARNLNTPPPPPGTLADRIKNALRTALTAASTAAAACVPPVN